MVKKEIQVWEKDYSLLIQNIDKEKLSKKVTQDEFNALLSETLYVGVNHEHRKEFLGANGYEVTRENMSNAELSARSSTDEIQENVSE